MTNFSSLLGSPAIVVNFARYKFLTAPVLALVAALHGIVLTFVGSVYALVAFAFLQAFCLPAWGALSDRIGRRKVILYSLSGTIVAACLALGSLFRLTIPAPLVMIVLGLATAGLPLSLAFAFSRDAEKVRSSVLPWIVGGFFGGFLAQNLLGAALPHLSYDFYLFVLLMLAGITAVAVIFCLPDAGATSQMFTGMNSMQKLWHGFSESNAAPHARWWKAFLATSGLVAGFLTLTIMGLGARVIEHSPRGVLLIFYGSAVVSSVACARVLIRQPSSERLIVVGAAMAALAAAIVSFVLKEASPIVVTAAAVVVGGAGVGASLAAGILHFAGAARRRSAGAELGAVASLWVGALTASAAFVLLVPPEDPRVLPLSAAGCAALSVVLGFMATRKARTPRGQ